MSIAAAGILSDSHSQSASPPAKKDTTAKDDSGKDEAKADEELEKRRPKGGFTGAAPRKITIDRKHLHSNPDSGKNVGDPEASKKPAASTGLSVVDQTVGDLGPLNLSLRKPEAGMAMPTGFQKVYRIESDSETGSDGRLMRANGGLAAVFDQSVYLRTEQGILPDIPSSTTWVIGGIPLGGESGHGMLLPIDPLDMARLPRRRALPPVPVTQVAGSHAGFGPGARIPAAAGPGSGDDLVGQGDGRIPSRFLHDRGYRASLMQKLLESARKQLRNQAKTSPADPQP